MSDTDTTSPVDRPLPPPLEARAPLCSLCREETVVEDDYFTCPDCDASWPIDHLDNPGDWDHGPDAEQCRSTVSDAASVERCWLTADHLGDHRNPNGYWTDKQADAPTTSGSAA